MRGGFTFRGIDIAHLHLHYAPENENTFVYKPTEVEVHEEFFEGHDGGLYYGVTRKPKEFILKCYFEDSHINSGTMDKINWLFRKGSSGKLVFKKRPWCYYYAVVTEIDDKELLNAYTGIIKITMKAYYPFARSDEVIYPSNMLDYYNVIESTAFLDDQAMMPQTYYANQSDFANKTILLYNPGTEYADVGIEIAGACSSGVIIENKTTKQKCRFVALSHAVTTNQNKHIYLDGINGKCLLRSNSSDDMVINSLYHDYGYINLAPAYPIQRKIFVSEVQGKHVTLINFLYDTRYESLDLANELYKGKFIYLNSTWMKIDSVESAHVIKLEKNANNFTGMTSIVTMNEIQVYPDETMDINRLRFVYKPTFA